MMDEETYVKAIVIGWVIIVFVLFFAVTFKELGLI